MRGSAVSVCVGVALLATLNPQLMAADDQGMTARGIYLGGTKLGVMAEIEIERNGQRGMVPANFTFKSGDHFWVHVTTNRDSYVYVLDRTVAGSTDQATRGVKLLAEEDKHATAGAGVYNTVFPGPGMHAKLVKAGVPTVIPGQGLYFAMDQDAGAEHLMVIASPTPLSNGSLAGVAGAERSPARRADSDSTVLARLDAQLIEMADNTQTEQPKRNISIKENPFQQQPPPPQPTPQPQPTDPGHPGSVSNVSTKKPTPSSTVGVAAKPGKPIMVELILQHLP